MKRTVIIAGAILALVASVVLADRAGLVYRANGGALMGVGSGALLQVESGGELDVNSGGTLDVNVIPNFSSFVTGEVDAGATFDTVLVAGATASTRWVVSLTDTATAFYVTPITGGFIVTLDGTAGTAAPFVGFGGNN